jgi:hypothetical protein
MWAEESYAIRYTYKPPFHLIPPIRPFNKEFIVRRRDFSTDDGCLGLFFLLVWSIVNHR